MRLVPYFVAFAIAQPAIATAEQNTIYADEIFEKAIEATGGAENYARLREIRLTRGISDDHPRESRIIHQLVEFPAKLTIEDEADGHVLSIDGWDALKSEAPEGNLIPAGTNTARELRSFLWREWWYLFGRYRWHGLGETFVEALQPVSEDGRRHLVLSVEPRDADSYRLYIDEMTGLPVKRVFEDDGTEIIDSYGDYRAVDGLILPFRITSWRNGVATEDIRYRDYRLSFDEAEDDPLAARIDAIVSASMREKHIPGLSLIVLKDGKSLHRGAYGVENVELDLPARMETVYPIASVSKIFAGIAAMQLVEAGALDLDASISRFIPNLSKTYGAVTVRQLLEHTHGISDPEGARDRPAAQDPGSALAESDGPKAIEDLLQEALSVPPKFQPGGRFRYSVFGYHILQHIIERVSGANYEHLITKRVLEPAGMATARFGGSERIITGRHPVDYRWQEGQLIYNALVYPESGYASAGLNASALDIAALFGALSDNRLMSKAAKERMWRESRLNNGTLTYYALGWGSYRRWRDGRRVVGHSGGGSSWVRHFPGSDLTVIALSNLNGARADGLTHDIADAVFQSNPQ